MGKISRAQRYKKETKKEHEERKICVFLTINTRYIAPDIQNIAPRTVVRGAPATVMMLPTAIRSRTNSMKYVRTLSVAAL